MYLLDAKLWIGGGPLYRCLGVWFSTEQFADQVRVWQREVLMGITVIGWKGRGRGGSRGEGRDVYGFRDEQ